MELTSPLIDYINSMDNFTQQVSRPLRRGMKLPQLSPVFRFISLLNFAPIHLHMLHDGFTVTEFTLPEINTVLMF